MGHIRMQSAVWLKGIDPCFLSFAIRRGIAARLSVEVLYQLFPKEKSGKIDFCWEYFDLYEHILNGKSRSCERFVSKAYKGKD